MKRADKEEVVAELVERLRTSGTLFVADYRGLSMTEIDGVRTELVKHGARFSVVKNTLTKRAAEAAGIPELTQFLDGPTAIAFVADGDMVQVAKVLSETARRTRVLAVKGGVLDGRAVSAERIGDLASLPPADVLRAQALGVIVGPLTAIASIFSAPLRDFVGVVEARIRQLEEAGDTGAAPREDEIQPEAGATPPAEETQPPAPAEGPVGEETQTEEEEE